MFLDRCELKSSGYGELLATREPPVSSMDNLPIVSADKKEVLALAHEIDSSFVDPHYKWKNIRGGSVAREVASIVEPYKAHDLMILMDRISKGFVRGSTNLYRIRGLHDATVHFSNEPEFHAAKLLSDAYFNTPGLNNYLDYDWAYMQELGAIWIQNLGVSYDNIFTSPVPELKFLNQNIETTGYPVLDRVTKREQRIVMAFEERNHREVVEYYSAPHNNDNLPQASQFPLDSKVRY
jgi:hypothetical protein